MAWEQEAGILVNRHAPSQTADNEVPAAVQESMWGRRCDLQGVQL